MHIDSCTEESSTVADAGSIWPVGHGAGVPGHSSSMVLLLSLFILICCLPAAFLDSFDLIKFDLRSTDCRIGAEAAVPVKSGLGSGVWKKKAERVGDD